MNIKDRLFTPKNKYKLISGEYNSGRNCHLCCFYGHRYQSYCDSIYITNTKSARDLCTRRKYWKEVFDEK